MSISLRVAIADPDPRILVFLEKVLGEMGHQVIAVVHDGPSLVNQCELLKPDVVITGPLTPELSGLDAAAAIYQNRAIPIILYARQCDPSLVLDAEHKHVFMYLVEPIFPEHLQVALHECHRSFAKMPTADSEDRSHSNVVLGSSNVSSYSYRASLRPPYRQLTH